MGRRRAISFQRSVKRTSGTPSRLNVVRRWSSLPGPNSSHVSSWIPYWTPGDAGAELVAAQAASANSSPRNMIRPARVCIGRPKRTRGTSTRAPYALQTSARWKATHAKRIRQAFRGLGHRAQDAPFGGWYERQKSPNLDGQGPECGRTREGRLHVPQDPCRDRQADPQTRSAVLRRAILRREPRGTLGLPGLVHDGDRHRRPRDLGAISGDDFYWPTISTTVGHLQDRWPVLTLIPVVLIVGYGYSALRLRPATTALRPTCPRSPGPRKGDSRRAMFPWSNSRQARHPTSARPRSSRPRTS